VNCKGKVNGSVSGMLSGPTASVQLEHPLKSSSLHALLVLWIALVAVGPLATILFALLLIICP
jgi:hypothetical protein